jgi:hypothetical protein
LVQANHARAAALGNGFDIFGGTVIHNHAFERRRCAFGEGFEAQL